MRTESIYKTVAGREAIMAGYDRALAAYFPPHEIRTIATRYGETAVIVAGDPAAAPLVLLHGAGSNSAVWAAAPVAWTSNARMARWSSVASRSKTMWRRSLAALPGYAAYKR